MFYDLFIFLGELVKYLFYKKYFKYLDEKDLKLVKMLHYQFTWSIKPGDSDSLNRLNSLC
jgi:hypothetical protein